MSLFGSGSIVGADSTDRIVNALENQTSMLENQRSDFRSFAQAVTSRINSNAERIYGNATNIRLLQTDVVGLTEEQTRLKEEQAKLAGRLDSLMDEVHKSKGEAAEAKKEEAKSKVEVAKANARANQALMTAVEAKKAAQVNEANLANEKAKNALLVRESMLNGNAKRSDLYWLECYDALVAYRSENDGDNPPKGYKGKKGLRDLRSWLYEQQYKHSRSILPLKRQTLLEVIPGWKWKTACGAGVVGPTRKSNRSSIQRRGKGGSGSSRAYPLRKSVPKELQTYCTESNYWERPGSR